MDDVDVPPVVLPGSEGHWNAYDHGDKLDRLFPGQDAFDLMYACQYNGWGPLTDGVGVVRLTMAQQGCNDEEDWIWFVELTDGTVWQAMGGCDYTGWDCQSWLTWRCVSGC